MAQRQAKSPAIPAEFKLSLEREGAIKLVLRQMHDRLPVFDRAEDCGLDCAQRKEDFHLVKSQLERIVQLFGRSNPGVI